MNRSVPSAATAMFLALLAAACGIPTSQQPEALPIDGQEELLAGTSSTTSTTVESDTVNITMFYIGPEDELESVTRPYEANPTVDQILADLEEDPSPEQQAQFEESSLLDEPGLLTSFVPPGLQAVLLEPTPEQLDDELRVISVQPEGDLKGLLESQPPLARQIVKQIVCTVLNLKLSDDVRIRGVFLEDDQGELDLTDSAAQLIEGPATVEHFDNCITGTEKRAAAAEAEGDTTTSTVVTSSTAGQS